MVSKGHLHCMIIASQVKLKLQIQGQVHLKVQVSCDIQKHENARERIEKFATVCIKLARLCKSRQKYMKEHTKTLKYTNVNTK